MICAKCNAFVEIPPDLARGGKVVSLRGFEVDRPPMPAGASVVCSECARKRAEREHILTMAAALRSIPERYRDAEWGSDALYRRVPDLLDMTTTPAALLSTRILLLHGESGAGKTSLASALFRWSIESTGPESHPDLIRRAQMSRFVDAREIPPNRNAAEGPMVAAVARRSSFVLLDDVGQEAGEGNAYGAHERSREVADVLSHIDKLNRPCIITTYGTPESWATSYGAGVSRRFWEADDAQIIKLHRRKRS